MSDSRLEALPVGPADLPDFLAYAAAFGPSHDESFVPGPGFAPGPEKPSFLLRGSSGEAAGAVSLLLGRAQLASGRGRFALLHSGGAGGGSREAYRALLRAALGAAIGKVRSLYLFLPEVLAQPRGWLEEAGFAFERTAYLMGREPDGGAAAAGGAVATGGPASTGGAAAAGAAGSTARIGPPGAALPEGYALEAIERGDRRRLAEFVAVRNRNFREVAGSSPAAVEDWEGLFDEPEALEGGILLLRSPEGEACGTLFIERDEEEGSVFVGAVSVDEGKRGRGLGRALVREAVSRGAALGLPRAYLSVNARNGKALGLYLAEGFTVRKAMSCLAADLEELGRRI